MQCHALSVLWWTPDLPKIWPTNSSLSLFNPWQAPRRGIATHPEHIVLADFCLHLQIAIHNSDTPVRNSRLLKAAIQVLPMDCTT